MFRSCYSLKNVEVYDTGKATNMTQMFYGCSELTDESLNKILLMCINATSLTGTKTLNTIGLSSTQATKCQSLSNWEAFVAAGWSTGY